ncbi:MAG: hypothetical protein J0H98_04380 [Solirubrobacterales bacterium]|nr:hypothetical protein [Solirubrobacterales bacterium]
MSDEEDVNWRDRSTWTRDPADYPDYPSRSVRSGLRWSSAGIAHLNNWHKFFAGLREKPPEKSGLFRPVDKDGNLYFGQAEDSPGGVGRHESNDSEEKETQTMWDQPRDESRIPQVIEALEARWQETPDQRLGQFLINLVRRELAPDPNDEANRLFSLEDDKLLEILGKPTGRPSAS